MCQLPALPLLQLDSSNTAGYIPKSFEPILEGKSTGNISKYVDYNNSIPVPVNALGGSKDDASEEDKELPLPSKCHRTDTTTPVPMDNTSSYWPPSGPKAHNLFEPSASSIRGDSDVGGSSQSIIKTSQEPLEC